MTIFWISSFSTGFYKSAISWKLYLNFRILLMPRIMRADPVQTVLSQQSQTGTPFPMDKIKPWKLFFTGSGTHYKTNTTGSSLVETWLITSVQKNTENHSHFPSSRNRLIEEKFSGSWWRHPTMTSQSYMLCWVLNISFKYDFLSCHIFCYYTQWSERYDNKTRTHLDSFINSSGQSSVLSMVQLAEFEVTCAKQRPHIHTHTCKRILCVWTLCNKWKHTHTLVTVFSETLQNLQTTN